MKFTIQSIVGCLMLCASLLAQEQPRQLRGESHLLGETAEQFYSEGYVGDVLHACEVRDWKAVSRLLKNQEHPSKANAKEFCATLAAEKHQSLSGSRMENKGSGDAETKRADTFTLDGGHLVKIEMIYSEPPAHFEGSHPKSFGELFAGLKEAYGEPTKSSTEPFFDTYGVKYEARRAIWMGKHEVIILTEQPGTNGWTEIVAETLEEYNRAAKTPKTENPLQ
jgi:hypothetical protein